jgi:hypothetical protein
MGRFTGMSACHITRRVRPGGRHAGISWPVAESVSAAGVSSVNSCPGPTNYRDRQGERNPDKQSQRIHERLEAILAPILEAQGRLPGSYSSDEYVIALEQATKEPQRGQPDASRQSGHGVSDVLYLAWLLVLGVVGVASGLGVSRSSMRRWSSDSRRSSVAAARSRAEPSSPTCAVWSSSLPVALPANCDGAVGQPVRLSV